MAPTETAGTAELENAVDAALRRDDPATVADLIAEASPRDLARIARIRILTPALVASVLEAGKNLPRESRAPVGNAVATHPHVSRTTLEILAADENASAWAREWAQGVVLTFADWADADGALPGMTDDVPTWRLNEIAGSAKTDLSRDGALWALHDRIASDAGAACAVAIAEGFPDWAREAALDALARLDRELFRRAAMRMAGGSGSAAQKGLKAILVGFRDDVAAMGEVVASPALGEGIARMIAADPKAPRAAREALARRYGLPPADAHGMTARENGAAADARPSTEQYARAPMARMKTTDGRAADDHAKPLAPRIAPAISAALEARTPADVRVENGG